MFVQYFNIRNRVSKQEILDRLVELDVQPKRITNSLAGSSDEWASYYLYNEGFYEADISLPMIGEDANSLNIVYRDYKAFKKLDAFFIGMGFEKKE